VSFCERCRVRARAFIRKADAGKPDEAGKAREPEKPEEGESAVAKAGKAAVALCVLCGAVIGPVASPGSAEAEVPGRAAPSASFEFKPPGQEVLARLMGPLSVRSPAGVVLSPVERGDSEPPHPEGPDQTRDGSPASHSGTAPIFWAINGLPQLSTLPYSGAVPTSPRTGSVLRNWALTAGGQDLDIGLPEHALLPPLPPVIRMPSGFPDAQAVLRSDRGQRGKPGRRAS
jgi:hypothetical protein